MTAEGGVADKTAGDHAVHLLLNKALPCLVEKADSLSLSLSNTWEFCFSGRTPDHRMRHRCWSGWADAPIRLRTQAHVNAERYRHQRVVDRVQNLRRGRAKMAQKFAGKHYFRERGILGSIQRVRPSVRRQLVSIWGAFAHSRRPMRQRDPRGLGDHYLLRSANLQSELTFPFFSQISESIPQVFRDSAKLLSPYSFVFPGSSNKLKAVVFKNNVLSYGSCRNEASRNRPYIIYNANGSNRNLNKYPKLQWLNEVRGVGNTVTGGSFLWWKSQK